MKTSILISIFIGLLFATTQSYASDIQYICWENQPAIIFKNEIVFYLLPGYRSENEREQVFDEIRAKTSNNIEFTLLYGFERFGNAMLRFQYDVDDIRVKLRIIQNIEGIEYAGLSHVDFTGDDTLSHFSYANGDIKTVNKEGISIDPTEIDFSNVRKQEVGCRKVTVSNTTDTTIHAQAWINEDDSEYFKILDGIFSFEIPPDSSMHLELEFRPDSTRLFQSVLKIDYGANEQPASVLLSGTGWPKYTSAEPIEQVADQIELKQNYPNPFNPSTQINFAITEQSHVLLEVYNTLGQKVSILVNETKTPGWHQVSFNASGLSSGTYIYRLETQSYTIERLMTFVK